MKKMALAVCLSLAASQAWAADFLPTKAPPPTPTPVYSWAGFYVGGNVGGGFATANVYDPDCNFCNNSTLHAGFGELGGQAGYNWQFGNLVVGLEGDINWQSFDATTGVIEGMEITRTRMDAFASVRGRAGLAFDRTLAYVTFGPAWGHANSVSTQYTNTSLTTIADQATDKSWHGGIAAGAGVEYMLAPNWAIRGEYLYFDFADSLNLLVPTTFRKNYAYSEQVARVGLDYQFNGGTAFAAASTAPILYKAPKASFPAAAAGWSGFYFGGNVGGGVAEGQFLDPNCLTSLCGDATNHTGFATIGGQAGYNAQWNAMVLGVVGDIDWASVNRSGRLTSHDTTRFEMDALSSVRARIGLAADRTLFYVTAGPAWGHFNSLTTFYTNSSLTTVRYTAPDDSWHLGLATGAGIEVMLDPHWSLLGEYLYYNFASSDSFLQPTAASPALGARNRLNYGYSAQVARVGVNYSFDGHGPAAGGAPQYFKAPAVVANWEGFYLGVNAGAGIANGDAMDMDNNNAADTTFHTAFAVLGGQGGYNWQWGSTVLGVEGDIDWASANATHSFALGDNPPSFGTVQFKMDAFASLRARAGLALGSSLIYVTAGPAIGHFNENTMSNQSGNYMYPWSGWQAALAAGAGVEYMLDPHWSVRAEYLHLAFVDKIANCPTTMCGSQPGASPFRMQYANSADVARVGLDYKFGPVAIARKD